MSYLSYICFGLGTYHTTLSHGKTLQTFFRHFSECISGQGQAIQITATNLAGMSAGPGQTIDISQCPNRKPNSNPKPKTSDPGPQLKVQSALDRQPAAAAAKRICI